MPTFTCNLKNNQFILVASVSLPGQPGKYYNALFDTGAQVTGISHNVVRDLGLLALRPGSITVANGQVVPTKIYRVRVDIPVEDRKVLPDGQVVRSPVVRGKEMEVTDLPNQPPNYDIILGMNFIRLFHITLYMGAMHLSN